MTTAGVLCRVGGWRSGVDDLVADGVDDEFGNRVKSHLHHDVGAMGLGGVDTDAEDDRHFLIALAFGEELKDFTLSRSQARASGPGRIRSKRGEIIGINRSGETG